MSESEIERAELRLKRAEAVHERNRWSQAALQELQRAQAALEKLLREQAEAAGQERLFEETP